MPWYDATFAHMARRRLLRRSRGTIEESSMIRMISWGIMVFGVSNAILGSRVLATTFDHTANVAFAVFGLAIRISDSVLSPRFTLRLLLLSLFGSLASDFVCADLSGDACNWRMTYVICIASGILMTVVCFEASRRIALRLLGHSLSRIEACWGITPTSVPGQCTYSVSFCRRWFHLRNTSLFGYDGESDASGRPHGTGTWYDSGLNGEILRGEWHQGVPVAPFRAFDSTTGYTFEAVLVGVCHNRAESIDEYWYSCRFAPSLQWGAYGVECSTAGQFYRHLPHLMERAAGERATFDIMPRGSTAVVFIHGFNSPVSDALKRVGQLWALGGLAALHPFVFGWPASKTVCYFSALHTASSARVVDDFCAFLRILRARGYERLHILAHSLGAAVLFASIDRLTAPDMPNICTVVLLNPDYPLQAFIDSKCDAVLQVCDHVTLYGDEGDGALAYSEFFNRIPILGKRPCNVAQTVAASITYSSTWHRLHALVSSRPLSIDVIDVSWMDSNMHAMRHNFFDLNRLMVDDLRDILLSRRRAHERTRLMARGGNVWSFLTPPRHIVNP